MTGLFRATAVAVATFMCTFVPARRAAAPQTAVPGSTVEALRQELATLKQEFEAIRRQYDDRLVTIELRLEQLGAAPPPPDVVVAALPPPAPAATQTAPSSLPNRGQIFNPDTSIIGNFLASGGRNPFNEEPALQLSEAELSFRAVVDPYASADIYLAASPEGLEIEEGYVTFTALPAGLLFKAGKMRAQFGKVNTLHTHAMPTADRPLVTTNLVGGEEGLSDSGLSVSRFVGNPWVFLEATGEVYGGRSDVFQSDRRSRLTYVGHLRGYHDLSEDKNLEIGTSYAFGPTLDDDLFGGESFNKQLFGVDATFRYRPLRRAIYRRLNLRTELIWSRQTLPADTRTTAFGFYGLGEYQFARRWYLGGRVDRSGRAFDGSLIDRGGSVFLTFWPTEFSQVRGQYRRIRFAEDETADELLFQINFAIGAHGGHVF